MQLSLSQTPKSISSAGYLLRQYGGAAAAYSLQRLDTGSENVVRVRRSSDDAEADFTAEEVSGGALASYCGAGNGFVTTWYDQSGNGRNATQATAASQPQIVASGVVVTDGNGNPSMYFDETDDFLAVVHSVTLTSQSTFIVADLDSTVAASSARLYSQGDSTTNDPSIVDMHLPSLRNGSNEQIVTYDGGFIGPRPITYDTPFLHSIIHSGSLLSPFVDGTAGATGSVTLNKAITQANIGARCNAAGGGGNYWRGKVTEIIDYHNSDQSASRTAIESNIANRYGITLA